MPVFFLVIDSDYRLCKDRFFLLHFFPCFDSVHTRTMKIVLYEGPPPQSLSEVRRTGSFFEFLVTDPPRGRPVGGGGNHRTRWIEK